MSQTTIYSLIVILLIIAGGADTWINHNRQNSTEIDAAVERLIKVPNSLGEWDGQPITLNPIVEQVAGCREYKKYLFANRTTGRELNAAILVGLPGPMSVHTPEVCWAAAGYTQIGNSFTRVNLGKLTDGAVTGEMIRVDFIDPKSDLPMRVWHGWFDGNSWSRSDYPRFAYFNRTHLYRMQVFAPLLPDPLANDRSKKVDIGADFLKDVLPELTARLKGEAIGE